MSRAGWTRWSDADVARLRALATRMTAEEIARELGRTLEQVRGAVRRFKVELRPDLFTRRRVAAKRSAGARRAWRDPAKRSAMLDGILARDLAGAAVAGCERRSASASLRPRASLPALARERLGEEPVYAKALARVPRGVPAEMRADVAADLVIALLEGADDEALNAAARRAAARHRLLTREPGFRAFDAPVRGRRNLTFGDTIAAEAP